MRMYSLTELNKGIEFGMCGKNTTLRMVPLSCDRSSWAFSFGLAGHDHQHGEEVYKRIRILAGEKLERQKCFIPGGFPVMSTTTSSVVVVYCIVTACRITYDSWICILGLS